MDISRAQSVLLEVIRNVLERFAFMFCEMEEDQRFQNWRGVCLQAFISFSGSHKATIRVTAPETLCLEMAGNILGLAPDEVQPEDGMDALKELVNVVCGELTPALYGDKEIFELSVPEAIRIEPGQWPILLADQNNQRLWVEDSPMLVNLEFAGGSWG